MSSSSYQQTIHTDVLIIGSGLIGAVYAKIISETHDATNILMVDMGQQGSRSIGDHKKNSIATQRGYGDFTSTVKGGISSLMTVGKSANVLTEGCSRCRSHTIGSDDSHCSSLPGTFAIREVGGMGSYWSCATPEQHPDIERSDLFSDEEWDNLYAIARSLFQTTASAFEDSIRHQLVKRALRQAYTERKFVSLPLACQRSEKNPDYTQWTCPATILGKLSDPGYRGHNFRLLSQHVCHRLVIDFNTQEVIGAELTDLLLAERVLVKAKRYVVCAGAVPTTGLLFNSKINGETGYPALGRYMTEQTMAVCQVALKQQVVEGSWNDPRCKDYISTFPEDAIPIPMNDPSPQITSPVSKEYPWHTQIQRDPYHYNTVHHSVDSRLLLDLRFFGYVRPVYENFIEFSTDASDIFGTPLPRIHYALGKEDEERAEAMFADMIHVASKLGDFVPGGEPRFLDPGAALHICGVTRAGRTDDGKSVVDRFSRVWRLNNLFLGGCGVIPTQNACNPTLTAACFAIAGARKLVEGLYQGPETEVLSRM